MDKISLAFIAPELFPNWGGVGTYSIELIKKLSGKTDIHVITVDRTIKDSKKNYSHDEILDYFGGKINLHMVSKAKDTFLYNARFQKKLSRFLPKLIKENKIDIIHSQHAHMSDILYKAVKRDRVKMITTLHTTIKGQRDGIKLANMTFSNLESSEKWQILLYPGLLTAEKYSLKRCENYITVSNWMKKEVGKQYPYIKNMKVIYNGTDPTVFKPQEGIEKKIFKTDNPVILFTSRMTVIKGAHYLVDAIPEIIKEHGDARFAFAGSGDVTPWSNRLKKRGIAKKYYSFLGYLDYSLLPSLYSEAYCYMLPTLYENFPIRMLEAMSSGTPVIASNVCGIPEALRDGRNGLLVAPRNKKQISDAVVRLLDNRALTERLGINAREDIKSKFTWDISAEKTLECYNEMLEDKA